MTLVVDDDFVEIGPLVIFSAAQAPFHTVEGLLVVRNKLSYRISQMLQDTAGRNVEVNNEPRLAETLFRRVFMLYNRRIDTYQLVYGKIAPSDKDSFGLRRVKLLTSDEDTREVSGYCRVFPTSFVCMTCGDFQVPDSLESFDPRSCRIAGCGGKYEQVSVVRYCENCGRVERMYYHCKNGRNHPIVLERRQKDLLRTWKFRCKVCPSEQMDILGLKCNHKDPSTMTATSNKPEVKFVPLTLKEGGVFTPVVVTTIDIPPTTPPLDLDDVEYILLGSYLGEFTFIASNPMDVLGTLRERYRHFKDPKAFDVIVKTNPVYARLGEAQRRLKLAEDLELNRVSEVTRELKRRFAGADIASLNDLLALKGLFSGGAPTRSFGLYLDSQTDETRKRVLGSYFAALKRDFWVHDITYVQDVRLISSCIGIINGINKFYERNFVPHFEPVWDGRREHGRFHAVVYPFRTEGILIELDQAKLVGFLVENGIDCGSTNPDNASSTLMNMNPDSAAYKATETVLHSMSHAMIRKSALRTGLDEDSLGELLFPSAGAFFIFSHSAINTGGLGFVFENSLFSWFEDTKRGIDTCTFDPICLHDRGACFACLYLPEHVCAKFNQSLDRDVFVARHRFATKVW